MFEALLDSKITATLLGVAIGFFLNIINDWRKNRANCHAHFSALRAEIDYCNYLAKTYLDDNIKAPLYRLPTVAYANALPAIIAAAALTESDTRSLLTFFNEVETLNRGLNQIESCRSISDPNEKVTKQEEEFGRNKIKAKNINSSYNIASNICAKHLCKTHCKCWK